MKCHLLDNHGLIFIQRWKHLIPLNKYLQCNSCLICSYTYDNQTKTETVLYIFMRCVFFTQAPNIIYFAYNKEIYLYLYIIIRKEVHVYILLWLWEKYITSVYVVQNNFLFIIGYLVCTDLIIKKSLIYFFSCRFITKLAVFVLFVNAFRKTRGSSVSIMKITMITWYY